MKMMNELDLEGISVLKSKLSNFIEKVKLTHVDELEEIKFCESTIVVRNEKIKKQIINGKQLEKEISIQSKEQYENKLKLFDKLFITYNEILGEIKEDIKKMSSNESNPSEEYMKNMRSMNSYIQFLMLTNTIERNMIMMNNLIEKYKNTKKIEINSINSIIRIIDIIIQNINDIETLPEVDENNDILDENYLKLIFFKSLR
jgi:signal recognition particle subunit SRP68